MNPYPEVDRLSRPLIEHYHSDLDIDRELIERHPGTPFLHWTKSNKCGTWLLLLHPPDAYPPAGVHVPWLFGTADRTRILRQEVGLAKTAMGAQLVLHFDGQKLRQVTDKQAVAIAVEHGEQTTNHWRREEHRVAA